MGVDYYPCCNCDGVACDCNVIGICGACEKRICHRCYDQCLRGSHTSVCSSCWNDDFTKDDLEEIIEYLLHEEDPAADHKEGVRQILRRQHVLFPPCVTLHEQEEKVHELIQEIDRQGLDRDYESEDSEEETSDFWEQDDDDEPTESEGGHHGEKHERGPEDPQEDPKRVKT